MNNTGSWSQNPQGPLVTHLYNVQEALDRHLHAVGISLNLSKANDVINRNRLLDKLDSYGIRGSVNNWFQSYLTNRTKFLKFLKQIEINTPNTDSNLHRG